MLTTSQAFHGISNQQATLIGQEPPCIVVVLSEAITGHFSAILAPSEQTGVGEVVCTTLQAKHQGFRPVLYSLGTRAEGVELQQPGVRAEHASR